MGEMSIVRRTVLLKRSVIFTLVLFISLAGFVWAQDTNQDNRSEFYVKTVPISKVYIHNLGYRVVYQKADNNFGVFYVPNSWFQTTGSGEAPKAELIKESSRTVPYFSIFWRNGEFDHIRLYLHRNLGHISYGDLDNPEEIRDRFDVETLELEF
jgi:hypothetical protein